MKIVTPGLVIREQSIGENDKLLTILTKSEGLIRAFSRSSKNIRGRLFSGTQLLCYSNFIIYKGKDKYVINEANQEELFFGLRSSIEKLALAQYICEIADLLAPRSDRSDEFLSLTLNALYCLAKDKVDSERIKAVYELRSVSLSGFMPDLICCKVCKVYESDKMYFDLAEGFVVCQSCQSKKGSSCIEVSCTSLACLRYIVYSEPKKIFSFSISEREMKKTSLITESYLLCQVACRMKALDFYNQINGIAMNSAQY